MHSRGNYLKQKQSKLWGSFPLVRECRDLRNSLRSVVPQALTRERNARVEMPAQFNSTRLGTIWTALPHGPPFNRYGFANQQFSYVNDVSLCFFWVAQRWGVLELGPHLRENGESVGLASKTSRTIKTSLRLKGQYIHVTR